MSGSERAGRMRRLPWVVVLIAAPLVALLVLGQWSGQCVDFAEGSTAVSSCTSSPSIGWPGAWAVLVLCVIVAAYAIARLVRARQK